MNNYPTPQIGHLTEVDYEHVYEPAEDTFALLDALETDDEALKACASLCVEIGTGSGIVTAFLNSILGSSCFYIGTDINALSCSASLRTAAANQNPRFDAVRCDAVGPLLSRVAGQIDVLVFNPPYVPTENDEFLSTQEGRALGAAWAGGHAGMVFTNEVIKLLPTLLSPAGRFYLVAVDQNKPLEIVGDLCRLGLQAEVILKRRAGRELLYIIRATR